MTRPGLLPSVLVTCWTLLVPTFPTFSLPNQMRRMVPAKADYIEDQVSGFALQVVAHRNSGILPMRVSLGAITPEAWKHKMHIDHDVVSGGTLELVLADLPNREWGSKAMVPH